MSDVTRRGLFKLALGLAAASSFAGNEAQADSSVEEINEFYRTITMYAYKKALKDPLKTVRDAEGLNGVFQEKGPAYRAALKEAAQVYLRDNCTPELRSMIGQTRRNIIGFGDTAHKDKQQYIKDGYSLAGKEGTLYYAIHDLAAEGIISEGDKRAAIDAIHEAILSVQPGLIELAKGATCKAEGESPPPKFKL